jgi:hypothetical protein
MLYPSIHHLFYPYTNEIQARVFFRPDSGTVPKEKRKEKKNSGLGVFQEKKGTPVAKCVL